MKILVCLITFIVIWLVLLTLCFLELSLENQKRDNAYTKIRNVVLSLQMMMEERTEFVISGNRNYNPIIRDNNDIVETLESASKNAFQSRYNDRGRRKDYEYVYEKNNFLMWRDTKTLDSNLIHTDKLKNKQTQAQKQVHDSRNLASSSKINEINQNNNIADHRRDNTNTHRVQNEYTELNNRLLDHDDDNKHYNKTTSCILLENVDLDVDNQEYNTSLFNLTMNLMTDARSYEMSFKLLQKDDNELAINSANDVNLLPNTLHQMEYKCFVSNIDRKHRQNNYLTNQQQQKNEMCYIFKLYDSSLFHAGQCCEFGSGFFEVSVNKSPISFGTNRLYGAELSASFCIDAESGIVTQQETQKKNNTPLYLSRECKNHNCICDSNPVIFSMLEHEDMYGIKMNVLNKMMLLSGSENLVDVSSPEYKAACWVLLDDPYEYSEQREAAFEKKIEERMIQRYILAMFYFATRPEGWKLHYQFLSGQSECSWNSDFSELYGNFLCGCVCDENENIISIIFRSNNLHGTLIDEIFGLNKLEEIHIFDNYGLHGTIPSTLGQLSKLQALELYQNTLEGTIPEQLFNATNLQKLTIGKNKLTGTLPKSIGKLQRLSDLNVWTNELTGTIPEELYSIESLVLVVLAKNRFSGSISQSIGNLKNMEWFSLDKNELSGTVPSTINQLSRLIVLILNNNRLSGTIPNIMSTSMSNLGYLALHNNEMTGTVSSDICNIETLAPDSKDVEKKYPVFDLRGITSDCRNDVLLPQVECSCCSYCEDNSPTWSSDCADTTIMIKIDHRPRDFLYGNSDDLVWSLVDNTSGNPVVHDGRYAKFAFGNDKELYEVCASSAGCYSLVMNHPPVQDTNYTIFWNGDSILKGTFKGYMSNNNNIFSEKDLTMTGFYYDEIENEVIVGSSVCPEKEMMCFGESVRLNNKHHVMYNTVLKISGSSRLSDESSVHSKALCWIIMNDSQYYDTDVTTLEVIFTQRYVLTLLHLMSVNGLFGFGDDDEFPPQYHECEWNDIECSDGKTLTKLSLPDMNQMIDGTLIDEIGSLVFLEVLEMSHSTLKGSIPRTFSNLYRLRELDLSSNALTGSIEETFFDMLKNLEFLNLMNNALTGEIPLNIGSPAHIHSIQLNNNRFTGSLPFENFIEFNLKKFDASENQLSGNISSLILKHNSLEYLNLGYNLLAGTLNKKIFVKLPELNNFNVSNNELTGIIPPYVPRFSNITHIDMHSNRFQSTLPSSLGTILTLEFLNLKGNEITGSIPFEVNNLKSLKLLALSHLKGSIPLQLDKLPNMNSVHLQNNELSGEAPRSFKTMEKYITDCGYPSVTCADCNICCNADGYCQKQNTSIMKPTFVAICIIVFFVIIIVIVHLMRERIIRCKYMMRNFGNKVNSWVASDIIAEKSVYHFFLIPNTTGWCISLFCVIAQLATLFLFVVAADTTNENTDVLYTKSCPINSLECDDSESRSFFGYLIFTLLLCAWLLKDLIASMKLFILAMYEKNIDFFFAAATLFLVTLFSASTSIYYNLAIATKDTDIITNAVILLFVNEIDERLYQLAETCNFEFVSQVIRSSQSNSFYDRKELIIHRTSKKIRNMLLINNKSQKKHKRKKGNDDEERVVPSSFFDDDDEKRNIENVETSCLNPANQEGDESLVVEKGEKAGLPISKYVICQGFISNNKNNNYSKIDSSRNLT